MRLTKKQTSDLLYILNSLEGAATYLERQDIAIMGINELRGEKIPGRWYSELHRDKEVDGPYTKFAGGNLALLPTAIQMLRKFVKENQFHKHPLIF